MSKQRRKGQRQGGITYAQAEAAMPTTVKEQNYTPEEIEVLVGVARSEGWAYAEKHASRCLDEADMM